MMALMLILSINLADWLLNRNWGGVSNDPHQELYDCANNTQCTYVKTVIKGDVIDQTTDWILFTGNMDESLPEHCDLILIHNNPAPLKILNSMVDNDRFFFRSKQMNMYVICNKTDGDDYSELYNAFNSIR